MFDRRTLIKGAAVGAAGVAALASSSCSNDARSDAAREKRSIGNPDVIVIGAGLSGLNAALLL